MAYTLYVLFPKYEYKPTFPVSNLSKTFCNSINSFDLTLAVAEDRQKRELENLKYISLLISICIP